MILSDLKWFYTLWNTLEIFRAVLPLARLNIVPTNTRYEDCSRFCTFAYYE